MEIYTMDGFRYDTYLQHHGTKGQKWGRRRYQNLDGSLTPLGRLRYGVGKAYESSKAVAKYNLKNLGKKSNLSRSERKAEKDKIREEAKSKVDEKVKKKYDAELEKYKADILKKDSLKEIMENKDIFSNAELDAIYVRKMSENKITNLQKQERGKVLDYIDKVASVAGSIKKAFGAYNDISEVSSKLFGDSVLPLTAEARRKKEEKKEQERRAQQLREAGRDEIMNNLADYSTEELRDLSQRAGYITRINSQMPESVLSQPASTTQPTQQQTQTQTQNTQQQTQQQTQTHQQTPTQQTQTQSQSQQQTQTQQQRRRRRNP